MKKLVLIVDFAVESTDALREFLEKDGFQVLTANDGAAGLKRFMTVQPDLVIMEAMLPKMNGVELCSRITGDPWNVPVIILSGDYKDAAFKTEALRTFGAAAYMDKPFDPAFLKTTIERLLNGEAAQVRGEFLQIVQRAAAPKAAPAPPAPKREPEAKAEAKAAPKTSPAEPQTPAAKDEAPFGGLYEDEKKKKFPVIPAVIGAAALIVGAIILFSGKSGAKSAPDTEAGLQAKAEITQPTTTPITPPAGTPEKKETAAAAKPADEPKPAPNKPEPKAKPVDKPVERAKPEAKPAAPAAANPQANPTVPPTNAADTRPETVSPPPPTVSPVVEAKEEKKEPEKETPPAPVEKKPALKAGDLVDYDSVDIAPQMQNRLTPIYPPIAKQAKITGQVTVRALITEAGAVAEVQVTQCTRPDQGFEQAAMDAVRKLKFKPAQKDGVNVKVWKTFAINFR